MEQVNGIEPSCLLPPRIHGEISGIIPKNLAKHRCSPPLFATPHNCWPRSTVGSHFDRLRVGLDSGFVCFTTKASAPGRPGNLAPANDAGSIPARGSRAEGPDK